MIETKNISYAIKGKYLIRDISLSFYPDEISMIIGPNGAGKSTLINLLSRQIKCTQGDILIKEKDLDEIPKADLAKIRAVLSQNIHLTFPLTVEEVVMMGRYPHFHGKASQKDKDICRQAMEFFKVNDLAGRNYLTLSGGEKQRVHFSRVTAQIWPDNNDTTKILLLDEPLTYLDIYYQHEFLTMIRQLMQRQRMIVVGVVHDLNLAYKYADKVTLLLNGNMHAHGRIDEVFTKPHIREAFRLEPNIARGENGERFLCF